MSNWKDRSEEFHRHFRHEMIREKNIFVGILLCSIQITQFGTEQQKAWIHMHLTKH